MGASPQPQPQPEPERTDRPFVVSYAQGWCALKVVHDRIDNAIERALQPEFGLSVREFAVLDMLARQPGQTEGHFQMGKVAAAIGLSQSATTRLVTRLEDRDLLRRFICPTDRRGIYTNVTAMGRELLSRARPAHDAALAAALDDIEDDPDLIPFARLLKSPMSRSERAGTV